MTVAGFLGLRAASADIDSVQRLGRCVCTAELPAASRPEGTSPAPHLSSQHLVRGAVLRRGSRLCAYRREANQSEM
jgi:hypothetical protein